MQGSRRSGGLLDALDCSPWGASCGRGRRAAAASRPLYTAEERVRRDSSPWTVVQGVLAPVQFAVFLVSLGLVARYLLTGEGLSAATWSVVAKTGLLYLIMVTGCIWEKRVFGRYLFAPAFYWEDVFSMLVLALHTAYLGVVVAGIGDGRAQMMLALAAYAAYVFNAAQFLLKLRAARRDEGRWRDDHGAAAGAA
ncbi:2-vinyl bacteriochlorophyllide hydratase [Roseomonas fluvialis]|uniref:2-vinyl bacteriochlorophyllide hydratase n=1 Tax=Roseomonas fluvialis TaxID=1750527 RepID=A0ABN6P120_9PROT|nr:2-vinyl bacteriochlorophyllide hydratase [Roseomonas fluvialis]BDG72269.1 2-vinyl bacteriochlorophyllide hydratase [Roseomonas fluvialis]